MNDAAYTELLKDVDQLPSAFGTPARRPTTSRAKHRLPRNAITLNGVPQRGSAATSFGHANKADVRALAPC